MSGGKVPKEDRLWYIAGAIVDQLHGRFNDYDEVVRILEAAVEEALDKKSLMNEGDRRN